MVSLLTRMKAKPRLTALKVAATLLPLPRPMLLLGPDAALRLCATMATLGVRHVLLVTDAVLVKLGVIEPLTTHLIAHQVGPMGAKLQFDDI